MLTHPFHGRIFLLHRHREVSLQLDKLGVEALFITSFLLAVFGALNDLNSTNQGLWHQPTVVIARPT